MERLKEWGWKLIALVVIFFWFEAKYDIAKTTSDNAGVAGLAILEGAR